MDAQVIRMGSLSTEIAESAIRAGAAFIKEHGPIEDKAALMAFIKANAKDTKKHAQIETLLQMSTLMVLHMAAGMDEADKEESENNAADTAASEAGATDDLVDKVKTLCAGKGKGVQGLSIAVGDAKVKRELDAEVIGTLNTCCSLLLRWRKNNKRPLSPADVIQGLVANVSAANTPEKLKGLSQRIRTAALCIKVVAEIADTAVDELSEGAIAKVSGKYGKITE